MKKIDTIEDFLSSNIFLPVNFLLISEIKINKYLSPEFMRNEKYNCIITQRTKTYKPAII